MRGRTAHESLFNAANGSYRGPSSQQGYSPFTTWTRGLAWAILGFAEQIEFLATLSDDELSQVGRASRSRSLDVHRGAGDRRLLPGRSPPSDGVPYWDPGAPGLAALGDWGGRPADPFNDHEPVDSSAAAIAAQGLLRLGHVLDVSWQRRHALRAGRACACSTRCSIRPGPYLSTDARHEGLLLHSVYHRPNNWDHIPRGSRVPRGESSQWGDYHAREAALYVLRLARGEPYLTFFGGCTRRPGWLTHDAAPVALVTGGTRGIGLGIARALAAIGMGSRDFWPSPRRLKSRRSLTS